jgi:hypothetical protein
MKTARKLLVFPLVFLTMAAGVASAGQQQHIINPSQLSAAVAERATAQDAERAAVREALARPEVQKVAASMGIDMARLDGAVSTMNAAELAQAASAAQQVNDQLVGGASTVVISTTTIIIALLVVLLIVVIAD